MSFKEKTKAKLPQTHSVFSWDQFFHKQTLLHVLRDFSFLPKAAPGSLLHFAHRILETPGMRFCYLFQIYHNEFHVFARHHLSDE